MALAGAAAPATDATTDATHPAEAPAAADTASSRRVAGAPDEAGALATKEARLAREFASCQKLLAALGDETRQQLILAMMGMGDCSGVRAIELADRARLSRPAVSHHLQIMKDAGLVRTRKEGTKVYYYFDPDMRSTAELIDALRLAVEITRELPDRRDPSGGAAKEA